MYQSKKLYHYGTGRRKKSVARVRLYPNGTGAITINGRDIEEYFGLDTMKLIVRQPFAVTETLGKFDVEATVVGGGFTGQAGAIRHASTPAPTGRSRKNPPPSATAATHSPSAPTAIAPLSRLTAARAAQTTAATQTATTKETTDKTTHLPHTRPTQTA